jgi:hypothetical protein
MTNKKSELSSFVVFDMETDDVKILRVNPPQDLPPDMPPPPEDDDGREPEPIPENVEDPTKDDDDDTKGKGDDDDTKGKGDDDDTKGKDDDDDTKGKDDDDDTKGKGDDDDTKGKGDDDDTKGNGDDDDTEGKGDDDDTKGKGDDDDAKGKGDDDDTNGKGGDDWEEDDEEDLETLIKRLTDDITGGSNQNQYSDDIAVIENVLSTSRDRIKTVFLNKTLAKLAIGNAVLFDVNNAQRIDNALNEIFE